MMAIHPSSLVLALALLALGTLQTHAFYIARNTTQLTPDLLQAACFGQKDYDVCDPYSRETRFVRCSMDNMTAPKSMGCPSGKVFDYVKRTCRNKSASGVYRCPRWDCPVSPVGPAMEQRQGQFGKIGNATYNMTEAGSFSLFCPVNGHCAGGMVIKVYVDCPAPPGRMPMVYKVKWEESVMNSDHRPKHIDNIWGYCGDSVFLSWDEPLHIAVRYNSGSPVAANVTVNPFPPQPIYKCPDWPAPPGQLPGEIIVAPQSVGPSNGTWTAAKSGTWYAVCPASNHCRLGMVFKVTVSPAPAGHVPVVHNLQWVLTTNNYEDMEIYVGDSLYFWWPSPQTFHGASMLPKLEEYY